MIRPIATTRSATGVPTGRLAVWWVIASEIVIFGGLIGGYVMHRLGHPDWANQAANTNTYAGAFNTLVLLTSSLAAMTAHSFAEKGEGKKAANYLYLTCLGGLTGSPQVNLPGTTENGAPVGLSIVGGHGTDLDLLAVARAFAATG